MASTVYVQVNELPQCLQSALSRVGYGRKDIGLEAREQFSPPGAYGDGYRAIVVLVNMATGETRETVGDWGGSNIFNTAPADEVRAVVPLAPGMAIISAQQGGGRPVSAHISLHPSSLAPLLPAKTELSDVQKKALRIYREYRGGYRQEYLDRAKIGPEVIDSLVTAGMLSRNRAGAIQVTTAGRNAVAQERGY